MIDLIERLTILTQQESTSYRTEDYLDPDYRKNLIICDEDESFGFAEVGDSFLIASTSGINESWREKICDWSYQVIDHFDFSREVVSVALNYLDRYLAKRTVNKKVFQLATMTSLFLAIKLFEPGRIAMTSMIDLSRGFFTVEQMVSMETSILRSLEWKVHPPTSFCFCQHFMLLLPSKFLEFEAKHNLLELSRFLTELSVIDYFFVRYRPSVIAYAAVLNAMEDIVRDRNVVNTFALKVGCFAPHLKLNDCKVHECRNRLNFLYAQGSYSRPINVVTPISRGESVSPVCVSFNCNDNDFQNGYHTVNGST